MPAGTFQMGDISGKGYVVERPAHTVSFAKPFEIGRYEITFDEWAACVADKGCRSTPGDNGFGQGLHPVINVSWADAQEYVIWLARKTKGRYRLPTEAEWEYAARAGSKTEFAWGDDPLGGNANCKDCKGGSAGKGTLAVGATTPNALGLFDMHGNIAEWVQDCLTVDSTGLTSDYTGVPADGTAAKESPQCLRILRGGAWDDDTMHVRSANRDWAPPFTRNGLIGFRVARDMN